MAITNKSFNLFFYYRLTNISVIYLRSSVTGNGGFCRFKSLVLWYKCAVTFIVGLEIFEGEVQ